MVVYMKIGAIGLKPCTALIRHVSERLRVWISISILQSEWKIPSVNGVHLQHTSVGMWGFQVQLIDLLTFRS